jgi:hypothetical protein
MDSEAFILSANSPSMMISPVVFLIETELAFKVTFSFHNGKSTIFAVIVESISMATSTSFIS